jgi:hypothetical protein
LQAEEGNEKGEEGLGKEKGKYLLIQQSFRNGFAWMRRRDGWRGCCFWHFLSLPLVYHSIPPYTVQLTYQEVFSCVQKLELCLERALHVVERNWVELLDRLGA